MVNKTIYFVYRVHGVACIAWICGMSVKVLEFK